MAREPIESRSLAAVDYDAEAKALDVEFRDGAINRYQDSPAAFHVALLEGESPGRFFSSHVRDAFECEPVEPSRPARPAHFG